MCAAFAFRRLCGLLLERIWLTAKVHEVSFPRAERLEGYLALPDGESDYKLPGVLVVHEIFGLNDNIKGVADRLAGEGYVALAVNLFAERKRARCVARLVNGMLTNSLDHEAIRDLKASLAYLAGLEEVDQDRLGAIGFSLGGSLVNAWACTDDRLRAVATYYSMNPRPLEAVRDSCPIVGSFPEKDFTGAQAQKLGEVLTSCGVPHDIKLYPETRHSFCNELKRRAYHPAAAEDSWRRTLEFFGRHVAEPSSDSAAS
ncbi:dienelactone hydrolase family protein [soil metagenome]